MKKLLQPFFLATIIIFSIAGCVKKDEPAETIVGNPGNPRFNLQFTNPANVDLDLYVQTPNGSTISFRNHFAQGGELDIDCLCTTCPSGPNENVFWVDGTAPVGTYKFWVEYYGNCGLTGGSKSSDYTLRLLKNSEVLQTYTGTLSVTGSKSPTYTFTR